jgi:hypothetical protein
MYKMECETAKILETGIYFRRGPDGEPGRGLVYRGF